MQRGGGCLVFMEPEGHTLMYTHGRLQSVLIWIKLTDEADWTVICPHTLMLVLVHLWGPLSSMNLKEQYSILLDQVTEQSWTQQGHMVYIITTFTLEQQCRGKPGGQLINTCIHTWAASLMRKELILLMRWRWMRSLWCPHDVNKQNHVKWKMKWAWLGLWDLGKISICDL